MIRRSSFLASVFAFSWLALGVMPANGGEYRVETRISAGARRWPETNRWIGEVVDRDGARLYRIERDIPFDFPYPTLTVANNGAGVLLDAARGRVEFLTPRGDVAGVWEPFASPQPSYERIIKCAIGEDAAAFLLSEPGTDEVRVVTTGLDGTVLRETAMPGTSAGEILIAPDASVILASATIEGDVIRHVTRVLDQDGKTVMDLPMLFRVGDIDPNEGRFVMADRYVVVGGSLARSLPEFRSEVCGGDRIVTAVRRGQERLLAVTEEIGMSGGAVEYRNPEVLILAGDGAILERTLLESTDARPSTMSREGDEIVVRAGTKTARFRGVL
jgi:hypothetical protein